MNKRQELEIARDMEADCTLGAGSMRRQRVCPACGKVLEDGEMHRAKPFEALPVPQFAWKRFWVCDATIEGLEKLVKTYREATWDQFVDVP